MSKEKLNIKEVDFKFLMKSLDNETDFYSEQRSAINETVLDHLSQSLNENDYLFLKHSLERVWNNGFRFGLYEGTKK